MEDEKVTEKSDTKFVLVSVGIAIIILILIAWGYKLNSQLSTFKKQQQEAETKQQIAEEASLSTLLQIVGGIKKNKELTLTYPTGTSTTDSIIIIEKPNGTKK